MLGTNIFFFSHNVFERVFLRGIKSHHYVLKVECMVLCVVGIPWLSNINCTRQESYLGKCGNVRWGSVEHCDTNSDAAVYCYEKEGMCLCEQYRETCQTGICLTFLSDLSTKF